MSYVVKIAENDKAILKIIQDEDASNPRKDWDNFGHMICFHSRYDLGDEHNFDDVIEFQNDILEGLGYNYEEIEDMSQEQVREILDSKVLMLPLYLYDHSGITMSTSSFSCRWDSGQVGYIYATHEEIIKEYGSLNLEKAEKLLIAEVKTFDQYIRGDVYGFILESKVKCDCCGSVEYEDVDSCYGFYGLECIEDELKSCLSNDYKDLIDDLDWVS